LFAIKPRVMKGQLGVDLGGVATLCTKRDERKNNEQTTFVVNCYTTRMFPFLAWSVNVKYIFFLSSIWENSLRSGAEGGEEVA
jgi:hypothetical protein